MPRRKSSPEPLTASARRESLHPFVEGFGRVLAQPGDEELGDLVVVHRIGVGRVGDPRYELLFNVLVLKGLTWLNGERATL